jgi:hypothetical protein
MTTFNSGIPISHREFVNGSFKDFEPEKHFSMEKFFEKYDATKKYTEGSFNHDYGDGAKLYIFRIIDVSFAEHPEEHQFFVIAERVLTEEETKAQSDNCSLKNHKHREGEQE